MKAVVDASVLLRASLPGEHYHEEAWQWLASSTELMAPRLLWFEVVSVLRRLEHASILDGPTVDLLLELLLRLKIRLRAPARLYREALIVARRLGVSKAYDGAYLALSALEGCPLVTLDERLIAAGRAKGYDVRFPATAGTSS